MAYEERLAAASAHIQKIRKDWGFSDGNLAGSNTNWILKNCIAMVGLLSRDLNSTETYFVLELLQNADDNEYSEGRTPEVAIRLFNDRSEFQFECNESGFEEEDVEALCGSALSTKKANPDAIGEKGIGFKSVFKIATIASVQSNAYSFEFNTESLGDYGMVVPTWVENASGAERSNGTLLTLKLRQGWDRKALIRKLETLNFSFLLFARRLELIKLSFQNTRGSVIVKDVRKETDKPYQGNSVVISTRCAGEREASEHYILRRHTVEGMPPETKRPSIKKHEIILAFPYRDDGPLIEDQQTFAYLPIKDFGFKFLIHADFILTANREDIDQSLAWNKHLRAAIVPAFRATILWLCSLSDSPMALEWPRYLPCLKSLPSSFLKVSGKKILEDLKLNPILLSEAGTIECPSQLVIVPDDFRRGNKSSEKGNLLLDYDGQSLKAVSRRYSEEARIGLKALGLPTMGILQFFQQYSEFSMHNGGVDFQNMDSDWHSQIADIIIDSSSATKRPLLPICRKCCNIPIRDRVLENHVYWVSIDSNKDMVYFENTDAERSIPRGLSMLVVDEKASADPRRREFFRQLGVRVCNRDTICEKIQFLHNEPLPENPQDSPFDLETCIAHAVYLFRSGWPHDDGDTLYVYDTDEKLICDTEVYIPFGEDGEKVNQLFPSGSDEIHRLHQAYQSAVPEASLKRWMEWLQSWCNLEVWPVLHDNGQLSKPMQFLLSLPTSDGFLLCLRHRFQSDGGFTNCTQAQKKALMEKIKCEKVCTDSELGTKALLKDTALPSLRNELHGLIPILRLGATEDSGWAFLNDFGVLTEKNADLYLQQLRAYQRMGCPPPKENLKSIYRDVGQLCKTDVKACEKTKNAFEKHPLVYIKDSIWLKPDECLWRAKFPCLKVPVLSDIYPRCKELFQKTLGINEASVGTIINELSPQPTEKDLDYTKRMLFALDALLADSELGRAHLLQLSELDIFPISMKVPGTETRSSKIVSKKERFWIADRETLFGRFEDRLWLLDVPKGDITKLGNVIKQLGLEQKMLSNAVHEERQIDEGDHGEDDDGYTKVLGLKVPFFLRIIAKDIGLSERFSYFRHQLSHLLVHRVESISLKSWVEDREGKIEGNTANGSAIIDGTPNGLQIYLRRRDNPGTGISPVFLSAMKDFLGLNEQSYGLFQRVMMCDDNELIREDLEKHGIGQIEQQLPHSASDTIAGSDDDDDESLTESDSSTSSIGPSDRQEAPTPSRTKARRRDDQPRIGIKGPNEPSSPVAARRYNDRKLSNASPSNNSRFRSPTPDPTEGAIYKIFQNGSVVDTTPPVARDGIAQTTAAISSGPLLFATAPASPGLGLLTQPWTPGSHATELSNSRPSDGTAASAFDTAALSDALLSIPSTPHLAASRSPSPSASPSSRRSRLNYSRRSIEPSIWDEESSIITALQQEVGFYGELFVFKHLKELLGPSISHRNWTSAYRNRAFSDPRMVQAEKEAGIDYEEFIVKEQSEYSDFTYIGKLGQYLSQRGRRLPRWKDRSDKVKPLRFHLEVKSTMNSLDEPFHLSNNQMDLAKKWTLGGPLLDVYVVLRVYNLDYENSLTAKVVRYVDPWRMVCDGTLHLRTSNSFELMPSNTALAIPFRRDDS